MESLSHESTKELQSSISSILIPEWFPKKRAHKSSYLLRGALDWGVVVPFTSEPISEWKRRNSNNEEGLGRYCSLNPARAM